MTTKNINKISILKIILAVMLTAYVISMMLPLLWAIFASLKTQNEFRNNVLFLPAGLPNKWSWGNFPFVLQNFSVEVTTVNGVTLHIGVGLQIWYTILYAVVGGFLATFIPCVTAYLCAKFPYRLSNAVYIIVIVTMILPIVGAFPSELRLLRAMGLYDSILGSWLLKANFLGLYFLVFHAMFKGVEPAFSEAAYMDGANEFTIMTRIILPLVSNIFLTVFIIKFIELWNDYQMPLLYMPSHPTLAYGIFDLSNSRINGLNNVPMRMAGCVMMITPIIILFVALKNKLMGNLTMGGVKG